MVESRRKPLSNLFLWPEAAAIHSLLVSLTDWGIMSLCDFNFKELVQPPLIFNVRLVSNERPINVKALGNTGADGYISIDRMFAFLLCGHHPAWPGHACNTPNAAAPRMILRRLVLLLTHQCSWKRSPSAWLAFLLPLSTTYDRPDQLTPCLESDWSIQGRAVRA